MSQSQTIEFVVDDEHTLSVWQEWICTGIILPQMIISSTFRFDGNKWIVDSFIEREKKEVCLPRECPCGVYRGDCEYHR